MNKEDSEYRNGLIAAEQKSQGDYDKTLVSLSGGALGLSLVFIKDIIGLSEPVLLWTVVTAWIFWAASLTSVVISYFSSRLALRTAINQADKKDFSGGIGGCAAIITQVLNALSGILFIIGVIFFIIFSANNLGGKPMSNNTDNTLLTKGQIPPPPPPTPQPSTPPRTLTEGVIPPPPPPPPSKK